jgi:hypothetical protein
LRRSKEEEATTTGDEECKQGWNIVSIVAGKSQEDNATKGKKGRVNPDEEKPDEKIKQGNQQSFNIDTWWF